MKLILSGIALAALSLATVFSAKAANNLDAAVLKSALDAHDRAVLIHDHWIRDPFIFLDKDGYYYLTGTTLKAEADEVIGIPVWRSSDLAQWEKLPRLWAVADSTWMPLKHRGAHHVPETLVWAPEIRRIGDKWVIVHTSNGAGANLLVSNNKELHSRYLEPMGVNFGKRHDPSIYVENGTPWLVWGVLSLRELKPDFSGFAGPQIDLNPSDRKMGHEGSYIIKVGKKYVWFGTAWSTDKMRKGTYNLYYATADSLTGPYGPRRFGGRFLGHGTPFQDKQGRWWMTAFHNANVPTLSTKEAANRDLSETAHTVNPIGTTLVPMEIETRDNDVYIRAKDPAYAFPGPDEHQQF